MTPLDALARATEQFQRRLDVVPDVAWPDPSTCDGWSVRDLVEHVVAGHRLAVALLDGAQMADARAAAVAAGFPGALTDLHREAAAAQLAAFRAPGALERVVHHPAGELPGAAFVWLRIGDLVLHGWDLARSTGGDESLDPDLVPPLYEAYAGRVEAARAAGAFRPGPGTTGPDAPLSARLLDLTGRAP